ncbi:MAG: DUF1214 domain-containing protein [Planctomycetota bacterium]
MFRFSAPWGCSPPRSPQDQRVSSTIPGRVDVAARDAAASSDSTATESLPQPPQNPREAWAYTTGKSIYVWAYPMVNMHNRRRAYLWANNLANIRNNRPRVLSRIISPEQHRGKVEPASPLHRVRMQSDYVQAEQRFIVCPNQDVAYGLGFSDLEDSPLVFQVPDFGERYWSFQLIDQRSDVFATPGSRLKSSTGHYLVVGPDWKGETPNGMTKVIRSPTRYICMLPRVFMDDTPEDRKIVQPLLNQVMSYPLAEYDGTIRTTDWRKKGKYRKTRRKSAISWVLPSGFWSQLADVLDEVPPLDGEEALYEQARKLVESSEADPRIAEILRMAAMDADAEIIAPLKQFRNVGDSYGNGWFGTSLGGRFDTNYFERTAVAVAYMLVNVQEDAFYLTADDDGDGESLDGSTANYQLTFPKGKLPPVEAFWSLTAYDKHHFFVKNRMKRYSVGTKTRSLQPNDDGSLTIYLQSKPPVKERMSNWLPIPADKFCVMLRCYVPDESVLDKTWQAPPIVAKGSAGE